MVRMNLRNFYAFYQDDMFVEVTDELAKEMQQWKRDDQSYGRKKRWHHAQYSLDCGDGIEKAVVFTACSLEEGYELKLKREQLYMAFFRLPDKQAKRIYAHFFLGMSKAEIAREEGVGRRTVSESIALGLQGLEHNLRKFR